MSLMNPYMGEDLVGMKPEIEMIGFDDSQPKINIYTNHRSSKSGGVFGPRS
jgi:hypothetical protein